jgi:uncharacterized Zn finger protein
VSYLYWARTYVSVGERRRQAERELSKLQEDGRPVAPVRIEGRTIAKSFWGKAWCTNLERYSDYASRLPRGRSYVRNNAVIDLQIAEGKVTAEVVGSDIYEITVAVAPIKATRWKAICRDCAGSIDSLVEMLQGRLAKSVMDRVSRADDGLFPAPGEIKLQCSCPDWADMCKHVAAVLYGVGARLDHQPQLLFKLRGVDEKELIASAGRDLSISAPSTKAKLLDESDVAAMFGIEMAPTAEAAMADASAVDAAAAGLPVLPRTPVPKPAKRSRAATKLKARPAAKGRPRTAAKSSRKRIARSPTAKGRRQRQGGPAA